MEGWPSDGSLAANINVGPEDFQMGVFFLEVVVWSL